MSTLRLIFGAALICASIDASAADPNYEDYGFLFNTAKNDGGFNESAVMGLARLAKDTGIKPRERVIRDSAESEAALRVFAARGVGNIMAIGFVNEAPIAKIAAAFPKIRFTLIDGQVDLPNVRSVLFREDEAAFLVGMAAGLASTSGKIGFVGALPIPPIRRFECGFIEGVRQAAPQAVVHRIYLGATPAAFRDMDGGRNAARKMIGQGVDVLFAAAGLSGGAVLETAAAAGKLGVGVDVNQNATHPGRILTSATKRVDTAVYLSWKAAHEGEWSAGLMTLGVEAEGVSWARDAHNEKLIGPMADRIDAAATELATGKRRLLSYSENPACQ